jgi:hypothetical protein
MILENTGPTTLTKTWYVNGTATDIGAVTIGIVDSDGNTIVASGTATTNNNDGTYEYLLPIQTQVKKLTISWTGGSQTQDDELEIVGAWLFTLDDLRAFKGADLASTTTYPNSVLGDAREAVTDEFEQICGQSFVPRFRREVFAGTGDYVHYAERYKVKEVIQCTVSGVSVSASNFSVSDASNIVYRTDGVFSHATTTNPRNVSLSYRHGFETVPAAIKRAALIVAHQRVIEWVEGTNVPSRATTWTDATGTYQSWAANDQSGRWYGMGDVDSSLRQYRITPIVW